MTIRIHGKKWERGSNELYEAERPERKREALQLIVTLAALTLLAWGVYPWMVWAVKMFFRPLMNYFNISY